MYKKFLQDMLAHWCYVLRVYENKADAKTMYTHFTKEQKKKQAEIIIDLLNRTLEENEESEEDGRK